MSYLICELLICLLTAALLGFLLGWFLRRLRCKSECDELRGKLNDADSERARLEARLRDLDDERDRIQLGNISQRAAVAPSRTPLSTEQGISTPFSDAENAVVPATLAHEEGIDGNISFDIEEIEGIGKGYGQRLRNISIATTGDLLRQCRTKSESALVAGKIGLDGDSVDRWVCAADLMRVEGLDNDYADLLVWSEVKNVQMLANENPADLAARATAVNAKEFRAREVPDTKVFAHWVKSASGLRAMLKH